MRNTSGTFRFQPAIDSLFIDAFEQIGIFGPALRDPRYMISARRSANMLLADAAANRGVNLWLVGDEPLSLALQPGISGYTLPRNVIDLADCWLRSYTPGSATTRIGRPLTPATMNGKPMLAGGGYPILVGDPSGLLSSDKDSPFVTLRWPAHGLAASAPVFFTVPLAVGNVPIPQFVLVERVIDSDRIAFLAPQLASESFVDQGAPPLYATGDSVPLVECIFPQHGKSLGESWTVNVATTLGGLTIAAGNYLVQYVKNANELFFNPTATATDFLLGDGGDILTDDDGNPMVVANAPSITRAAVFENTGRALVATQSPGVQPVDIYLWQLSRSEYAMLPDKFIAGRPTQLWFNRTITPEIVMWPIPPANAFYGLIAFRMRTIEDADPVDGQTIDLPGRFLLWFVAELAALLAQKWRRELFQEQMQIAQVFWERASGADTERVSTYILPTFDGYYR